MNRIETEALNILKEKYGLNPCLCKRYIDDIILGPFNENAVNVESIQEVFNSIHNNLQFTMEIPHANKPLHFLDIGLSISI